MVTILTSVIFLGMMILITVLDCHYYDMNWMDCFMRLFIFDPGLREWMVYLTFIFGMVVAIVQDLRYKNKKYWSRGANGK